MTSFPTYGQMTPFPSTASSNPLRKKSCNRDVEDRQLRQPSTPLYLPPTFSEGEEWICSHEERFDSKDKEWNKSRRSTSSRSSPSSPTPSHTNSLVQKPPLNILTHTPSSLISSTSHPTSHPSKPHFIFPMPSPSSPRAIFALPSPSTPRSIFPLPSPFRRASDSPCSVVVRPSVGSFLNDYQLYDDLHIGVADSKGVVIDFDKGGIRVRINYWNQCLVITEDQLRTTEFSSTTSSLTSSAISTTSSADIWDETLKRCVDVARWTREGRDAYDGEINNCLDFVLRFIQLLNSSSTSSPPSSSSNRDCDRVAFTRQKLLPLMESSMKYIQLYRKLIHEVPSALPQTHSVEDSDL